MSGGQNRSRHPARFGYATYADLGQDEVMSVQQKEAFQTTSRPQNQSLSIQSPPPVTQPTSSKVVSIPATLDEWRVMRQRHPLILLYIWKQSCLPCLKVKPALEQLANELFQQFGHQCLCVKDQIDDAHLMNEQSPSFVHWKMCQAVPFFIIYEKGQIKYKITGFNERELRQHLQQSILDLGKEGVLHTTTF